MAISGQKESKGMVNQVKVGGKLVRDVYIGSGKSGPYASAILQVEDGKYNFWLNVYAPNAESVNAFRGAVVGEMFEAHGSLVENKRTHNGEEKRTIQVKADKVIKVGAPARPHSVDNGYITDDDIPF